jgi:hypothetical protein
MQEAESGHRPSALLQSLSGANHGGKMLAAKEKQNKAGKKQLLPQEESHQGIKKQENSETSTISYGLDSGLWSDKSRILLDLYQRRS